MKKLLLIVLLFGASSVAKAQCSNTAYGSFTCVSTANAKNFTVTSQAVTLSVTTGNAVIGMAYSTSPTGTLTVAGSGSCGGTITTDTPVALTGLSTQTQFTTTASSTGTCTITASDTASANMQVIMWQWSGWSGVFDARGSFVSLGYAGVGTARTCPAVTTATAGDLVLCNTVAASGGGGTYTATSPFAIVTQLAAQSSAQEEDVQATAGAITPGLSYSAADTIIAGTITLKVGSSSCPVPTYSLAAGNFTTSLPRSTTITSTACTICYTTCSTSGCTPTTPAATTAGTCSTGTTLASGGTVNVANPGYETILSLGTAVGNTNSLTATGGQYHSIPTLTTLGGTTVGSTLGNVAKLNGTYINPYTGYVGTINGVVTPFTALAVDALQDFHAGTNGSAPAAADVVSSVYGDTGNVSANIQGGAGLLYATAANLGALIYPVDISSAVYTGGTTTLGVQCTTTTSVTICGTSGFIFSNASTVTSVGFWLKSSCLSNGVDCGALGGIYSNSGTDYATVHFDCSVATTTISLESPTSGCVSSGVTYTPGTLYRINIQMTEYPGSGGGSSNLMTVCNSSGTVLGTATATGAASAHVPNEILFGITGEEPTTAGYTYEWSDMVISLSGKFSSTRCLL